MCPRAWGFKSLRRHASLKLALLFADTDRVGIGIPFGRIEATMSSKEELLALATCPDCGSRSTDFINVPGGWLEFSCGSCGNTWWHDTANPSAAGV